ncbi:AAA domain-containing protein [Candidatus Poriferisodalis sp.]|uniref:AAA domain-containing protein n=1 Tax=Candidatus Poriferisodalis sp. TaxID=3101277 RepID=UPI003B0217BE
MQLTPGEIIALRGTIRKRRTIKPKSGTAPLAKAVLVLENDDEVPLLWWDAAKAPANGMAIELQGTVKNFDGTLEVHVSSTKIQTHRDNPTARIIEFYRECVEAEAIGQVQFRLHGDGHLELGTGTSTLFGACRLPSTEKIDRWCQQHRMTVRESITAGWPLVVAQSARGSGHTPLVSPLLTSEARIERRDDAWWLIPQSRYIEFNPYALDLFGFDRDDRETLTQLILTSATVDAAKTAKEQAESILEVLTDNGIVGLDHLDSDNLVPPSNSQTVCNSGIVYAGSGSTQINRKLLEDLEELANQPDIVESGPAAVFFGLMEAPTAPLPTPYPTITPSTLAQDQAVASAMENVFTVVTGPPGTGKSQVLVNAVAAAVAQGETVLFASKNNKAVDVVFERLKTISPNPCLVRAGPTSLRSTISGDIKKILSTPPQRSSLASARRDWDNIRARVQSIHGVVHERARLEDETERLESEFSSLMDRLPDGVQADTLVLEVEPGELEAALACVETALDAFTVRLGLFKRWPKHQARLQQAQKSLSALGRLVGLPLTVIEQPLTSVLDKPRRSLKPRAGFKSLQAKIDAIEPVWNNRRVLDAATTKLSSLPTKHELDDQLHAVHEARIDAGRKLLEARWEQVRRGDTAARTSADKLADQLQNLANGSYDVATMLSLVPKALPALPVWGVTNMSARTNLPLKGSMFDLVVIDEASQCDIASAVPLLARGRRALIIGDQKQLIHISSLSPAKEHAVGERCGLSKDQREDYSYRNRSCFGLAASRVRPSPIFLDLHFRSHPGIIGFSNQHFYDGRLEFCYETVRPQDWPSVNWLRTSGDIRRDPRNRSYVNRQEADALVAALAGNVQAYRGLGLSVGVVTPYRAQADLITEKLVQALGRTLAEELTVATAHKFQGDERDVIYFSPVVGPSMSQRQSGFAAGLNLLNVAVTRARSKLVICDNLEACLQHDNLLAELARYVVRLEAGGFDSPLELQLHEALLEQGVAAETGVTVAGYRLDLAVRQDGLRIDIECDGAAFHQDGARDRLRDEAIETEGWQVLRFSGRRLSTDLDGCVDSIMAAVNSDEIADSRN